MYVNSKFIELTTQYSPDLLTINSSTPTEEIGHAIIISISDFQNETAERYLSEFERISDEIYRIREDPRLYEPMPIFIRLSALGAGVESIDAWNRIEEVLPHFSKRTPDCAIYSIRMDHTDYALSGNMNSLAECFLSDIPRPRRLEYIRHKEFCSMLNEHNAIYIAPENWSFALPSGEHTKAFFRIGNIQASQSNLQDLAFWIKPRLGSFNHIIAESWSISTLIYHMARASNRPDHVAQPHYLSSYFNGGEELRDELARLCREIGNNSDGVPFLISACSTGNSMRKVSEMLKKSFPHIHNRLSFIPIVGLRKTSPKAVFDLSDYMKDKYFEYGTTPPSTRAIAIHPSSYTPTLTGLKAQRLKKKDHMGPCKNFFERYAGLGAFRVHATDHRGLHHTYYIDFERIVATHAFTKRMRQAFKVHLPSAEYDLVVSIDNAPNRLFFTQLLGEDDSRCIFVDDLNPSDLTHLKKALTSLKKGAKVLFLESVSARGDTLGWFAKFVRDSNVECVISYFIGIARPASKQQWRDCEVELEVGKLHNLAWVELVFLPRVDAEQCPWCKELALLSRRNLSRYELQHHSYFIKRGQRLRQSMRTGLADELFLHEADDYEKAFDVGPGSLWLEIRKVKKAVSDGDITLSVAAGIQLWRTDKEFGYGLTLHRADLHGRTCFNDPKLRAAIWRATQSEDIFPRSAEDVAELEEFLKDMFSNSTYDFVSCMKLEALMHFGREIKRVQEIVNLSDSEALLLELFTNE